MPKLRLALLLATLLIASATTLTACGMLGEEPSPAPTQISTPVQEPASPTPAATDPPAQEAETQEPDATPTTAPEPTVPSTDVPADSGRQDEEQGQTGQKQDRQQPATTLGAEGEKAAEQHPLRQTNVVPKHLAQFSGPKATICDRTPEVQAAIIEALAQVGPELPCSAITPDELFRLRKLSMNATTLQPSDLDNIPNLHELSITTRVKRLRDLTPGTFRNMEQLTSLELNVSHPRTEAPSIHTEEFIPNLFNNLRNLGSLVINIDQHSPALLLNKEPFRGLSRLKTLQVNHIQTVDPGALDPMKGLHAITLAGKHRLEASRQDPLPQELLKNQLNLQRANIEGLELPGSITLGSFEAACHAQEWLPKSENGQTIVVIFVDRQKVELIQPGPEDRKDGCLLRVGDNRIIEVLTTS